MAGTKKKRKQKVKNSLKYEVYGILILIFSVITLASSGTGSGIGSVGRSLGSICFFLVGRFPFIIPVICIYIGLYVMIFRKWPKHWSYRKTGIVLAVLSLLVLNQMELMNQLYPDGSYTAGMIMKQPIGNLQQVLNTQIDHFVFQGHSGGGLIGAVIYGILYFLLDEMGAMLIVIALVAISFVLITGLTYTDLFVKARNRMREFIAKLKARIRQSRNSRASRSSPPIPEETAETAIQSEETLDSLGYIDEENYNPHKKTKKKAAFWDLLMPDRNKEDDENPELDAQDEEDQAHVLSYPDNDDEPGVPVIRDFLENVEHRIADDEADLAVETEAEHHLDDAAGMSADSELDGGLQGDLTIAAADKKPQWPYQLPPFSLLSKPANALKHGSQTDYKSTARKLEATLESFGVRTKVLEVVRGPTVTRYEIQPDVGVKVSRIVNLTDDIALALAAKDIRMEAPIPGKAAIGIEVPNEEIAVVTMREVMESSSFHEADSKLSIALGRDISGHSVVANLAKMPHLLVAGATGSGKSVCINGIIASILYKAKPDEVKFLMIDPKMVELNVYNGIPHLLAPVVTDPRRASLALKKIVVEMEKRYELFSKSGTRNIEGYNALVRDRAANGDHSQEVLPYIVLIVDELADLMMVAANDVEDAICRLAQMARAAGIHLIIATQRPSVDVITGLIKANIPSRIAFGVSSQVDSRTILDSAGAEKLLGRGDMLFMPVGASKPLRIQGAFLSDHEVESVVDFVRKQAQAEYQPDLVPEVDDQPDQAEEILDELYDQAVQIIIEAKQASVSLLQRRMRIGYTRAARLIDSMEANAIVGPYEGSKPREVLVTMEQYQQRRMSS